MKLLKYLLILGPCISLHAIAMDIFVPCIPAMTVSLKTNSNGMQWVLSIFLLSTGIGQPIAGLIADRYGRRLLMLSGLIIFASSSMWCSIATSVTTLITARFFQGLGACATTVASLAIVRDVFDQRSRSKVYSYLNGIIAIAPMFAPLLGSILLEYTSSWRYCFYFLTGFSAIGIAVVLSGLEETRPVDSKGNFNFLEVLYNSNFWACVLCSVTALSCLFCFFSVGPVVMIEGLGISTIEFGMLFASNAIVFLVASIACSKIQDLIGEFGCIQIGAIFIVFGSLAMLIVEIWMTKLSVWGIMSCNYIITTGVGLTFGPSIGVAMQPFSKIAGTAAAAYGTIQYCFAGIIGAIVVWIGSLAENSANSSMVPMASVLAVMGCINLLLIKTVSSDPRQIG